MADLAAVVDRMVVAVLMVEEAPTVAAVSRAAAHVAAVGPMAAGSSTLRAADAPIVAPMAEEVPEEEILTAAGAPAVAAVILRLAETSPPNEVEALTAAPMAEVPRAVEE
jgi:hypothetical protein